VEKISVVINLLYIYQIPNEHVNYKRLPSQPLASLAWFKNISFGITHKRYFLYFANGRTRPEGGSASTAKIITTVTLHKNAPRCFGTIYFVLQLPQGIIYYCLTTDRKNPGTQQSFESPLENPSFQCKTG